MDRKRLIAATVALALACGPALAALPLRAYIGTGTPDPVRPSPPTADVHGQGIYLVEQDPVSGRLSAPKLVAKTPSPNWIAMDPAGSVLYAGNEYAGYDSAHGGSVTAYAIDRASGALTLINTASSQGAGPAYVSVDGSGKFVLVANYSGMSAAVLPILPGGGLGEASDTKHPTGPLNPDRAADNPPGQFAYSDHTGTHPHMIAADPSGRFVMMDDAGLDQIVSWRLDAASGKLVQAATFNAAPGSAPRHFVFDGGRRFYQLFEQDSKVGQFDFDPDSGKLSLRQMLSTLPNGFAGSNLASEIVLSRRHLYVANRLADTIAVFALDAQGRMTAIQQQGTHGDYPRNFTIDPSGRFLYALNQRSDSVTIFRIDAKTGLLHFTNDYVPVGSPTVMLFQH